VFKVCIYPFIIGATGMNFDNFSVCEMFMKFCGECPSTIRLLVKIWFLLFDNFQ
jgi:hypothetical protein